MTTNSDNEDYRRPALSPAYQSRSSLNLALPPPLAFSDRTDLEHRGSYDDSFKDYIDVDRNCSNNNSPETMSFYSDSFTTSGSTSGKKRLDLLSPTWDSLDRCGKLRQSLISSGSSGISINSYEVSDIRYPH